jgi:hypothetical protein
VGAQRIIERERRWAAPAAVAAVLTFALYLASFIIDRTASLYTGASDARQLVSLHDHAGTVLVASVVRAAAFVLLPIPFLFLFRAAQARNPRVQAAMVGFVFIGPILFAAQGVIQAAGAGQAASDFLGYLGDDKVQQALDRGRPPEPTRTYAELRRQVKTDPGSIDKVTIYTGRKRPALEVQRGDSFYAVSDFGQRDPAKVASNLPGELDGASPSIDHETDSDSGAQPGDALATHATDNANTLQVSQALLFPAVLGLVVMMIYVPLQAQRVGLLTRFFGSFGMALGASMILILPVALLGALVWVGYLGLLFVGRVPGGRPPAWDAGEAVPWPRPGEEGTAGAGGGNGAIEGKATEVGAEQASRAASGSAPEKRKRKRRR